MPSQDDLSADIDFPIYEDLSHGGELKSTNPKSDPYQRVSITERGRKCKDFNASVRMVTCVHGVIDATSPTPTPASLIVLQINIRSPQKSMFERLYASLTFSSADPDSNGEDIPRLMAWAPFQEKVSDNPPKPVDITKTSAKKVTGIGATGPGGIGGTLSGDLGKTTEMKYQIMDGKLLDVIPMNRNPDCNGIDAISWTMEEGRLIHEGIPTTLRVAVLVKRSSNRKFNATFELELRGCLKFQRREALDRLFGRAEIDDPIRFDPGRAPQGELNGIKADALGDLVHGESLQGLGYFVNPIKCE
jgi:hypothetical protein